MVALMPSLPLALPGLVILTATPTHHSRREAALPPPSYPPTPSTPPSPKWTKLWPVAAPVTRESRKIVEVSVVSNHRTGMITIFGLT